MPHLVVIGSVVFVIRVGVSHSRGRLHVQHIGHSVPAEGVLLQGGPIGLHLRDIQGCLLRFIFQYKHKKHKVLTWNGPFSDRKPSKELQPGPPFSHSTRGSAAGSRCDVTNLQDTDTVELTLHFI